MRCPSSLSAVVLAITVLVPSAQAQSLCESMKVKAAGKMFSCITNAYSNAYKRGTGVPPEVITKCETKFATSCAKGAQRNDCDPITKGCNDLKAELGRTGLVFSRDGCTNPPAGLVAWWPFDEQEGNIALDIAPQLTVAEDVGNNATRSPGTFPIFGKHSLAMSGWASAPSVIPHNPTNLTLDAWVHDSGTVINYSDGVNGYELYVDGDVSLFEQCSGVMKIRSTSGAPVTAGVWTHVAVVADDPPEDKVTFYINGVAHASSPSTYTGSPGLTLADCANLTNTTWYLGSFAGVGGINGLDELEVFERALTANELAFIVFQGKGKCKPPCM